MGGSFDYHYGNEAEQYSFYRVPKILITDDRFKHLSTDAKLLYGLMLDRMSLSIKNGWMDDEYRVYIYFTLDDIMEQLNCQHGKAVKLLAELDTGKGIGLINRVKQGQGRPAMIYVMKAVSERGNMANEAMNSRLPVIGNQDFFNSEMQTSENRKSRVHQNGGADFRKTAANNTKISNTEMNELNRSIYPTDAIDLDGYRNQILHNIGYYALCDTYSQDTLNEVVELMLETICVPQKIIRIAGTDYPSSIVKSRLAKLDQFHIEYVIDCMRKNTTKVRNIKQYLLTALYNAPTTMGHYYQAEVNYDEYGKGGSP